MVGDTAYNLRNVAEGYLCGVANKATAAAAAAEAAAAAFELLVEVDADSIKGKSVIVTTRRITIIEVFIVVITVRTVSNGNVVAFLALGPVAKAYVAVCPGVATNMLMLTCYVGNVFFFCYYHYITTNTTNKRRTLLSWLLTNCSLSCHAIANCVFFERSYVVLKMEHFDVEL
uniref:Uncharacterized protein n=1 Tax=Glossina brevipalpis TaxID=37001 RepID=A0A1A9WS16_9MUSC